MPALNWDAFAQLPGSAETNFEMLCRAIVRRHYAQFGSFAALAGQPGVEFHLKLHTSCLLGEPGRWYGWQCRWYDLPGGTAIGSTRRAKIVAALDKTAEVLPGVTDWVLWTRRRLTEGDQEWFYALKTNMQLHLWTVDEVEEHLSGPAEILRGTYFGELVLTPESLAALHSTSVAPIRRRWVPEVHQAVDAERELRKSLGETDAWADLRVSTAHLEAEAAAVDSDIKDLAGSLADEAAEVAATARSVADFLAEGYAAVGRGDLDLLRQQFASRPILNTKKLRSVPRQLRALRHPAALTVTNALAETLSCRGLLDEIETYLSARLIAVLADAGGGKTELAAQLTAPVDDRPAGILLLGGELQAGRGIDDLARHMVVQGAPVASMEALVAALDAAGQRAHRRLPIVIDGLNEAEDSRDWKGPLAALDQMLFGYPYVVVVCTVRPEFADECLPREVTRLEIPNFGHDTAQAVRKYFEYYRINAPDADLPWWLLRRPLALRLFCEVTNPKRERTVGIEAMPGSLTALFDRYLEQASERIAELAPRSRRYYEHDVRAALDEIGRSLWQENSRSLEMRSLRQRLGDIGPWNESIVRALEQDGVLLRTRARGSTNDHVQVLFDSLSGHLVADAILTKYGHDRFEGWVREPATVVRLTVAQPDSHPLAQDILFALVGLVPRRLHGRQLWQMVDEPIQSGALLNAADLEGKYLDAATVDELARITSLPPTGSRDLLDRLRQTRGSPTHPLNAEFLGTILGPMTVAQRDLRWTEWVRRKGDKLLIDLQRLEKRWHNLAPRSSADQLCAQWVMWTLTSTVHKIRDQATRALYWFGLGDADALFHLALSSLTINDLYVPERVLAASYGVAMAHQLPNAEFANSLRAFLGVLRDNLIGLDAQRPTNHWLIRQYVQGTVELALTYHPSAIPAGIFIDGRIPFAAGPTMESIPNGDPRAAEADRTLRMDFENYTLGRLFRNRRNYDGDHTGHQAAVAHVRGSVWANGWRESGLGSIDGDMGSSEDRGSRKRVERYGKKYGWIGFYTYAGILNDWQLLERDERLSDVQIDPSFPEPPPAAPMRLSLWTSASPVNDREWMRDGIVDVPDELFERADIGDSGGPWIAVHGELANDSRVLSRRVWGRLTALLVAPKDAPRLMEALRTRAYPGNFWLPEIPSDYYTFAGEVPWSPEFGRRADADSTPEERYCRAVELEKGRPVAVEVLAHEYAWEGYHSELNQAGGSLVPSRSFSVKFDLRGIPQSFDQSQPDKTIAARSLRAPDGFSGNLLYLRKDLLRDYAAGRRLIWFMWGERNVHFYSYQVPEWVAEVSRDYANVWRRVVDGGDLSSTRGSKPKVKRPKRRLT